MKMTLEDFKSTYIETANKQQNVEITNTINNRLEEMGDILFNQFKKLSNCDVNEKDRTQLEINKTNSMASSGKILLQATATQLTLMKNR